MRQEEELEKELNELGFFAEEKIIGHLKEVVEIGM
jgi:hypothetical protein